MNWNRAVALGDEASENMEGPDAADRRGSNSQAMFGESNFIKGSATVEEIIDICGGAAVPSPYENVILFGEISVN